MTDATLVPQASDFTYDRLLYSGHAFSQTHPDRLATLASLHGLEAPPVERCRVLELGCGDGANLIPMAYQLPDSAFIGIDLSARAIEAAAATADALGLGNVTFQQRDIADLGPSDGRFDYIIAHGVYSWVPEPVRARIMEIFRDSLAPAGVAYLSYNAYPGFHLREIARGMMLYRVRGLADPKERVEAGRSVLERIAEASDQSELYGYLLKGQWDRVRKIRPARLYHDDLDETTRAFFLWQVVEDAEAHGLQYLSDASFPLLSLDDQPEPVAKLVSQIPDTDAVGRDQYLDFAKGSGFRTTLLCHRGLSLQRPVRADSITRYQIAAEVLPPAEAVDPCEPGIVQFATANGGTVSTDHGLSKAAFLLLSRLWPQAIGFAELVDGARELLGASAATGDGHLADVDTLTKVLFRMVSAGRVAVHRSPPRLTTQISERPQASLVARHQAANGPMVTNLRHIPVLMEDQIVRQFLAMVDGTRSVDEIVSALNASSDGRGPARVGRQEVERNLAMMARLALLVD